MALRIRRGTNAQRTGRVFETGEIVYTTDAQQLWIGDGLTSGGIPVVGSNIAGYGLLYNATTRKIEVSGITSDDVTQGTNNKYFTTELAVDAVGAALVAGNATNVGITFTYSQTEDDAGRINATVALDGVGIGAVIDDTSPQLGGNLDLNENGITGTGTIDITGNIDTVGYVTATAVRAGTFTADLLNNPIDFKSNSLDTFNFYGVDSVGGIASLQLKVSAGTVAAPTNTSADDVLGGYKVYGYRGGDYKQAIGIIGKWDADADFGTTLPKSTIIFGTGNNGTGNNLATFDGNGVFTVPTLSAGDGTASNPSIVFTTDGSKDSGFFHPGDGIICISTDATERVRIDNGGMRVNGFMKVAQVSGTLPSPAEAGMIVLDGTTFKGYNGSAWVALN